MVMSDSDKIVNQFKDRNNFTFSSGYLSIFFNVKIGVFKFYLSFISGNVNDWMALKKIPVKNSAHELEEALKLTFQGYKVY